VLDTCKRLEKQGFEVTYLPVDEARHGRPRRRAAAITDKTILVSA
jgi:cysteine desulfurase